MRRDWMAAVSGCFLLLCLTACGDDAPAAQSGSSQGDLSDGPDDMHDDYASYLDGAPDCSDFWVEGERMPKGYSYCEEGKSIELHNAWKCAGGELIAQTRGYAWVGGPIVLFTTSDPSQDPAFVAEVRDNDCRFAYVEPEPGQPFVATE